VEGANAAGVEGLCWALEAMARRKDRTNFLQSLRIPVLIVHGSVDKIVPGTGGPPTGGEFTPIPILVGAERGSGHASPLEAPDQVAAALGRFTHKVRDGLASPLGIIRPLRPTRGTTLAHFAVSDLM